MKKRGQLVYKALIIIIASAIIILAFIEAGKSYGSQDAYYKLAVAKDLALLIDGMYATSGDVKIMYGRDLSKYTVAVNGNIVKIYKTSLGVADVTAGQYKFFGNEIANAQIENPRQLIIAKANDKITLSKE